MFNIVVEWVDQEKSRARFALPGRQEWRVEHITALINVLAEIRAEMTPACAARPAWKGFVMVPKLATRPLRTVATLQIATPTPTMERRTPRSAQ